MEATGSKTRPGRHVIDGEYTHKGVVFYRNQAKDTIEALYDYNYKPDDIILATYPKCGERKKYILFKTHWYLATPLSSQWRQNEHDGVLNHQSHECLLTRLCWRRSKKTLKLRVTGLCVGNSPVTGEFPAQRASYAENVSIWWRHHVVAYILAIIDSANCLLLIPRQAIAWANFDFFFTWKTYQ